MDAVTALFLICLYILVMTMLGVLMVAAGMWILQLLCVSLPKWWRSLPKP